MNRRFLTLSLLLCSSVAAAAPATVKVFEATAHERPDSQSPAVHTFVEGAQLSVSETGENGFRRVRLPDGGTGWIAESAIDLGTVAADAPVAPPAKPMSTASNAKVFVKDLKHLAELVKPDAVVAPKAQELVQRETTSSIALYGGMIGGTAVGLGGFFLLPRTDCTDIGGSSFCSAGVEHYAALAVGAGIMLAGTAIYYAMVPKRNDLLDVLNLWNERHPEDPFEVTPAGPGTR